MNPKILILKESDTRISDEGYDIVIHHPNNCTKEFIDELVKKAIEKFNELSERATRPPAAVVKQLPQPELRKKRKRIYR